MASSMDLRMSQREEPTRKLDPGIIPHLIPVNDMQNAHNINMQQFVPNNGDFSNLE